MKKYRKSHFSKCIKSLLIYLAIAASMAFFLFPIFWEVISSFKMPKDAIADPPLFVFNPSLQNWRYLISERNALYFLKNSLIVAAASTGLTVVLGSMVGYALARLKFRGRKTLTVDILTFRMLPPIALVLPFFLIMKQLDLLDTYIALVIAYTTFNLPFGIILLKGFFTSIPPEIEDAAMVDGCSRFMTFRKIILPLASPGLVATAIFCVILSWNEFIFASILTGKSTQTLPVLAATVHMRYWANWGAIASVALIIALPVLLFALSVQKHLIRGLTLGAVKG